jgi:signal transduction histidine kinase/CheY-like chemotaxis protein
VFVAGTIVFQQSINTSSTKIVANKKMEAQFELNKLLSLHNTFIQSFVLDNAKRTEMLQFVYAPNTHWIDENIMQHAKSLNVDFLMVYNNEDKNLYKNGIAADYKFHHDILEKNFSWQKPDNYPHYFTKLNNEVVEIFAAPIMSKEKIEGYLIAGKIFSEKNCTALASLISNTSIAIANDTNKNNLSSTEAELTIFKKLVDENNNDVAYLKVTGHIPDYANFSIYLKKYNIFFVAFSLVILTLLLYFISKYINSPLNKIFKTMEQNNIAPIAKLKERQDEFGQLARLINMSFLQKKRLVEELDERKKAEMNLRRAIDDVAQHEMEKSRAIRSDEVKTEFINNISHELRTPMNAVVSISTMLSQEKLDDKQANLVKVLNFSARQLTSLVSDILDFSKIENGTLELDEEPFNLMALCTEMIQMLTFRAQEKHIGIFYYEDLDLNRNIIGDPHRLNQVLFNLMANAIKFTEKGKVDFIYKILKIENDIAEIKFEIIDTGIGIAPEELDRIFERFNQANSEIHQRYGGTGLGLTLCTKLVEMMGSRLQVKTQVGIGSNFYFTLKFPLAKAIDKSEENRLKTASGTLEGLKILVAEDHEINCFVLKQFFKQWKVEAVYAENGKLALECLEKEKFDLILMDLQMPIMDGFEAVQHIRNRPDNKYKKLPIIALTANAAKETRDHVLKNGFDLFISKPFDPTNLHQVLFNVKRYTIDVRPDIDK